jgi:hypothetical protein
VAFCREIMQDSVFRSGHLSTEFIPEFFARRKPADEAAPELDLAVALAAAASFQSARARTTSNGRAEASRWATEGRGQLLR